MDQTMQELDQQRDTDAETMPTPKDQQDQQDKNESDRKGNHCEDSDTTKSDCSQEIGEVGKMDKTMQELDKQRVTDAETMPTPKDQQDKNESDRKGNHCEDSNTNKSDCSQEISEEHPEEAFYDTH